MSSDQCKCVTYHWVEFNDKLCCTAKNDFECKLSYILASQWHPPHQTIVLIMIVDLNVSINDTIFEI